MPKTGEEAITVAQFRAYMLASRRRQPTKQELIAFARGDDPIGLMLGGFVHRETIRDWATTKIKRF